MKRKTEMKITKNMKINDAVNEYSEIIPVLMDYGLHCVGCHFSALDTIESGAKLHGLSDEDIKMMIKDCNELIKELGDGEKN